MEKTIIFVAIALSAFISNAQEVIELETAEVGFINANRDVTDTGNTFTFNITENMNGEFSKDPVNFVKTHFDIKEVISSLGERNYDYYNVSFISQKGELNARFDESGNLTSSSSRFKNIAVPIPLQHQMYRDYKGWVMVKSLHVTSEVNGNVKQDFYKITLKKGNKKRNLKINTSEIDRSSLVAVN